MQLIFNIFLAAPVVTAVVLQFFIRVILEMFLEISPSFIGAVCAVFPPGCVQMLTAYMIQYVNMSICQYVSGQYVFLLEGWMYYKVSLLLNSGDKLKLRCSLNR